MGANFLLVIGAAKMSDEISDGVLILAIGQANELNARAIVAGLRFRRIGIA